MTKVSKEQSELFHKLSDELSVKIYDEVSSFLKKIAANKEISSIMIQTNDDIQVSLLALPMTAIQKMIYKYFMNLEFISGQKPAKGVEVFIETFRTIAKKMERDFKI